MSTFLKKKFFSFGCRFSVLTRTIIVIYRFLRSFLSSSFNSRAVLRNISALWPLARSQRKEAREAPDGRAPAAEGEPSGHKGQAAGSLSESVADQRWTQSHAANTMKELPGPPLGPISRTVLIRNWTIHQNETICRSQNKIRRSTHEDPTVYQRFQTVWLFTSSSERDEDIYTSLQDSE